MINGNAYTAPVSHVVPNDGEYHLLVITLAADGDLTFYMDDLAPYQWATGVTGSRNSTTQQIKFGQDFDNSSSDSFTGELDEVEIFNTVLTQEDVMSLFNAGSAGKCDPPRLTVTKTTNDEIDAGDIEFGDPITWVIRIENTGTVPFSSVDYFDDKESAAAACPAVSLAPGETDTCTYFGTALLGEYENTAIVTAQADGEDYEFVTTSQYNGVGDVPPLTFEKFTNGIDGDAGDIPVGAQVTWTYVVTNNTNYVLDDFSILDSVEGEPNCPSTVVEPGTSLTCSLTGTAVLGEYMNDAEFEAELPPLGVAFIDDSGSYTGTAGLACPTGLNVLFVIDNSGSISPSEYADFADASNAVADELLLLGSNVRIAAAHYGTPGATAQLYIETDFAHASPMIGAKQLDGNDDLAAAMADIHSALKGLPSSTIVSPQQTLNADPSYKTHIVVFTDAAWDVPGSSLIDTNGPGDWDVYNEIKKDLNVSLSVVRVQQAGNQDNVAAIASPGGQYTGAVAANPGDPFMDPTPRRLWTSPVADFSSIATDLASDITTDCYLDIDKTTDGSQGRPFKLKGQSVQWDYTVTNTGTIPITGITVNDDMEGVVTCPLTTLAGGQSMSCTPITGTAKNGGYQNTATAVGSLGAYTVTASDTSGYISELSVNGYVGLVAERILDTRDDVQGEYSTAWGPGEKRPVTVLGVGGVPESGVEAVVLNVTTVSPTAAFSWLTVDPAGAPSSGTAAHNFGTASATTEIVNDLIVAKVGADGAIDITNAFGDVDIVIDVVGYFTTEGGATYEPLDPERILDTRNDTDGEFSSPWGDGETRSVRVAGVGAVPESGVDSVVLNVTTVSPTAAFSWLTVNPTGTEPSTTAAHTFGSASFTTEIVNDVVVAKVGEGGFVDFTNAFGDVDIVIDVVGYYATEGGGSSYLPLEPVRLLDSRNDTNGDYDTPWAAGQVREIQATEFAGCSAVAVHITSVNPTAAFSWLTVTPEGEGSGTAAHNFGTDARTSELSNDIVIAKLGADGSFSIENALGSVDLVIDLVGLYGSEFTSDLSCVPAG